MDQLTNQQVKSEKNNEENYSYEIIKTIHDEELFLVSCNLNKTGHKDLYLLKKIIIKKDMGKKKLIQKIDRFKSLNIIYLLNIYGYFIEKKEQEETLCIL